VSVSSYDDLNKDLAKRVAALLGTGDAVDFQVRPTPVDDPIGTLYIKARSVAVDDMSCVPSSAPQARSMPNAFPSYALDRSVAAEVGLSDALLQGIASAGVSVQSGSSVSFTVLDPQLKALTDSAIRRVLTNATCADAAKTGLLIVRGYVVGQRNFMTKADLSGGVKGGVVKVGNVDVDGTRNDVVSVTDRAPQEFLQILSEVASASPPPPVNGNPPPVAPNLAPTLTAPKPVAGAGQIFVQQDNRDAGGRGSQVVALLKDAGLPVNPGIEKTASDRTPVQPQVRYFSEADKPKAEHVLEQLKQQYPDAVLRPMKIQAPPGQMEVWLPRAK